VGGEFKKEAGMKLGGHVVCKDLLVRAGTSMGYTVCVEQGENMSADGKPVVVSHRATSIYRLENGRWKLVHHHTDISPELAAATGTAK
jgi:ketosteroid isomerase-like protein